MCGQLLFNSCSNGLEQLGTRLHLPTEVEITLDLDVPECITVILILDSTQFESHLEFIILNRESFTKYVSQYRLLVLWEDFVLRGVDLRLQRVDIVLRILQLLQDRQVQTDRSGERKCTSTLVA
jgi:hypothetical protein